MATDAEILKLAADFKTKWAAMVRADEERRKMETAAAEAAEDHFAAQKAATAAKEALQTAILSDGDRRKSGREFF